MDGIVANHSVIVRINAKKLRTKLQNEDMVATAEDANIAPITYHFIELIRTGMLVQ
jgi:hypothetical protein